MEESWEWKKNQEKKEEVRVYTSFVVKITGWRSLISKAGITMFAKVWLRVRSPRSRLVRDLKYFPSYLGPLTFPKKLVTWLNKWLIPEHLSVSKDLSKFDTKKNLELENFQLKITLLADIVVFWFFFEFSLKTLKCICYRKVSTLL